MLAHLAQLLSELFDTDQGYAFSTVSRFIDFIKSLFPAAAPTP